MSSSRSAGVRLSVVTVLLSLMCGLGAGRIGRSYSDRCLEILTGLLALKQEHITSGKPCYSTRAHILSSVRMQLPPQHLSLFSVFLFLSLTPTPPQRWCRQCVTWSGCVLSVVTLCVWLLRAARRRCRIARSDTI